MTKAAPIPDREAGKHKNAREDQSTLVQQAVTAVKEFIATNALQSGQSLPGEAFFSTKLGISRAAIREAFGELRALRLIDVSNGRRAKVGSFSGSVVSDIVAHSILTGQASLSEAWELRHAIEVHGAGLAATARTADQAAFVIAQAEAIALHAHAESGGMALPFAFHTAVARSTNNALFRELVAALGTITSPSSVNVEIRQYRAVAEAIATGAAEAARVAMSDLLSREATLSLDPSFDPLQKC